MGAPPVALVLALAGCGTGAVEVAAGPPERADRASCRALLDGVPDSVADLPRREVEPADAWAAAWGDPPLVLTCRSDPPAGFDRLSSCTTVNGVDWFVPEEQLDGEADELTITTVHRRPFVRLTLPAEHFPPAAALVDLAALVEEHTDRTGSCV